MLKKLIVPTLTICGYASGVKIADKMKSHTLVQQSASLDMTPTDLAQIENCPNGQYKNLAE
jgi:hypothetical protein